MNGVFTLLISNQYLNTEVSKKQDAITIIIFVAVSAVLCASVFYALHSLRKKKIKDSIHTQKRWLAAVYIAFLLMSLVIGIRFGPSVRALKGILFTGILAYASLSDIMSHTAENFLSIELSILGLVGSDLVRIAKGAVAGLIVLVLFCVIVLIIRRGGIGGADIKITSAAFISLGLWNGLAGLFIGLITGVVTMLILSKRRVYKTKEPFALLPFISIGLTLAFVI